MQSIADSLPPPMRSGADARWFQQTHGARARRYANYLPPSETWLGDNVTARISARALQDAIATGDFSGLAAKYASHSEPNPFQQALERGQMLKACRIETAGIDEDDDYVVFEFEDDPAVAKFKAPDGHN